MFRAELMQTHTHQLSSRETRADSPSRTLVLPFSSAVCVSAEKEEGIGMFAPKLASVHRRQQEPPSSLSLSRETETR